jgi:hypothetical protein
VVRKPELPYEIQVAAEYWNKVFQQRVRNQENQVGIDINGYNCLLTSYPYLQEVHYLTIVINRKISFLLLANIRCLNIQANGSDYLPSSLDGLNLMFWKFLLFSMLLI